jgi:hypothetical protein
MGIDVTGPKIRGPRISLFPFRIRGFSLSRPRLRVKPGSGDAAAKAGASALTRVANRVLGRLFGGLFKR